MRRPFHRAWFGLGCALLLTTACGSPSPERFQGVIEEATPGSVTVRGQADGTRVHFLLDGADTAQAYGFVRGNRITVQYRGRLRTATPALHVATDPTYARAVGAWVIPDPITPDSVMGFRLLPEGKAQSIRLATLRYTSWETIGTRDTLLLRGVSEGTGAPEAFSQRALFGRDSLGREVLQLEGSPITLTRR